MEGYLENPDTEQTNEDRRDPSEEDKKLWSELVLIDASLRRQGSSIRAVIEHVARNAFGITMDFPHADTRAYLEKLVADKPK